MNKKNPYENRIEAFITLGSCISEVLKVWQLKNPDLLLPEEKLLYLNIEDEYIYNPWFTSENIVVALQSICDQLQRESLETWIKKYPESYFKGEAKRVAVIMAGNIPLVGFHDFLCVLIAGHSIECKLSHKDSRLLKKIAGILIRIEPLFDQLISFTEEKISDFDAIIATGSNNSSRYFEHYFEKYPSIIRHHRSSVAVLTGNESEEELKRLGADIFTYFGLGCRNVSKLYLPVNYDFNVFFEAVESYHVLYQHNKYANNYDYHQSVYLMNKIEFKDNGFLLLKEDEEISSPLSVIFYEYYSDIAILAPRLKSRAGDLQCVVCKKLDGFDIVDFGMTQKPEVWSYADNRDTLEFLSNI